MKEAEFNKQKELDSSLNNLTDFKSYVDKFLPAQSKKSDDELNSEHSTIEDSLIIDEDKKEKGILEPTMSAEDVQEYLPFGVVYLYNIGEALRVPKKVVDGLGLQYALSSEGSAIEILGNHSGDIVYVYGNGDRKLIRQQVEKVIPNYNSRLYVYSDGSYKKSSDGSSSTEYRHNDLWGDSHDTPVRSSTWQNDIITNFAPYPAKTGGEMRVPLSYTYYGGMAIPNSVLAKLPRKVDIHHAIEAGARLRGKDVTNNLEQTLGRDMPNEWDRALRLLGVSKDNDIIKYGFFTIDNSTNEVIFCFPKWITITSNTRDLDNISITCLVKRFRKTEQKILPSGLVKKTKYLSTKQNGNGQEYIPDGKWEGRDERSEFTRDELLFSPLPHEVASYNALLWDGVHYQNIIPTENGAEVKESAPVSFSAYMESIISELKEYPSVNGISTSDDEDAIYDMLVEKYGKSDVERQYKDEDRYPYECDFYIKSEDLFIEYLKHWTHGRRKYNPDDPSCQDDVKWLEGKAKDNAFYERCLRQWTEKDPEKFQTAEENGIKLLVFYNIREFLAWYENPELTYEEYKDPDPLQYDSDAYFASKAKGQNTNGNDRPKDKK